MSTIKTIRTFRSFPQPLLKGEASVNDGSRQLFHEELFDEKTRKVKDIVYAGDDSPEQVNEYTYDDKDRLIKQHIHYIEDDISETISYEYDGELLMRKKTEYGWGEPEWVEFEYNADGLLVKKTSYNEDEPELKTVETFAYDGKQLTHHLKKNEDGEIVIDNRFTYDENGKVIEEYKMEKEENDIDVRIKYENVHREEPDAKIYTKEGKLIEEHTREYDADNRLVRTLIKSGGKSYQEFATELEYNEQGRQVFLELKDANQRVLKQVSSSYNEYGHVTEEHRTETSVSISGLISYTVYFEYEYHD
jgi:hypothetical protein